MMQYIYYVYKYIKEDNTPYYSGIGHTNRINEPHKNVKTPCKEPSGYVLGRKVSII